MEPMEQVLTTVVVIPAYQPGQALLELVKELYARSYPVLVVDDGSGAAYAELFAQVGGYAHLLRYEQNRGKGTALKTAYDYILHELPQVECILTMDADGQHLLHDGEVLLAALRLHPGGLVLGCRTFDGHVPFCSRFGNRVTRAAFRLAAGQAVGDTQTGLRAFGRELLPAAE